MLAPRRNCFAISAGRLRPRPCRSGGRGRGQGRLVNVASVGPSCRILACDGKDFRHFVGGYMCSDELVIAINVIRLQQLWTNGWA